MDDLEVQEDDNRVDPNELDTKFQLLRKIETENSFTTPGKETTASVKYCLLLGRR